MPYFKSEDGLSIHYEVEGEGPEVVMVHGWESSLQRGWRSKGVTDALKTENRCVMIDCRGHGESDKPHDPKMYGARMLSDIVEMMDHLGIDRANVLGYSMGSHLTLNLLLGHPERVRSAILGGHGLRDPIQTEGEERYGKRMVEALLADSMDNIDPRNRAGREFRRWAEDNQADLKAVAAVWMGRAESTLPIDLMDQETLERKLGEVTVPLMTVIGNDDLVGGDNKPRLAMLIPNGCHLQIEGKDHLTVVPDPKLHMAVKAFLRYVNGLRE